MSPHSSSGLLRRFRPWLALLTLLAASAAWAEGSRNLHPSGALGLRAWLEQYTSGAYAGIPRSNSLEVFVQAGETLALGSSAHGLGTQGGIRYTRADGSIGNCATGGSGNPGRIANRTEELAGAETPSGGNTAGYLPCFVTVGAGQGGIWRVQFLSPNGTSTNPVSGNSNLANANWTQLSAATNAGTNNSGLIAAWDITVFSGNTALSGRAWADYLPLNVGDNNQNYAYLSVYVLTNEGYLFRQDQQVDPFGYIFFANNRGFLDAATLKPVFKSITSTGGGVQAGYAFHRPDLADTTINVTHKLFFNQPGAGMPAEADYWAGGDDWLYKPAPVLPPQVENLHFIGVDGTPAQAAGVSGGGGTFYYTNPGSEPLSVQITIPLSVNGVNTDRILNGLAPPGESSLTWNGLDGSGNPVYLGGVLDYTFTAALLGAEVHFPFFDVERSQYLKIQRLNGHPASQWPLDYLYWDHSLVSGTGQPTPLTNLAGLPSQTSPAMVYSTSTWGNDKGLDAWTYLPSATPWSASQLQVGVADLRIVKTADLSPVGRGGVVAYTLEVDNLSAETFARNARVQDVFAAAVSAVTWTCEIVEPGTLPADKTSQCLSASGSGNIDAYLDLRAGAKAVFKVRGTVSATAPATLANTATVSRGADAADPNLGNNTSTVTIPTVPGRTVSGQVYEDLQPNSLRDAAENWAGGVAVWVSLVKDTGEAVQSRPVAPGGGAYSFAGVPSGSYRLILTDSDLSAIPVQPAGFSFIAPANGILNLNVAAANVTGQDFGLFRVTLLEGRVFEDNGAGGGIPHNGLIEGGEAGLAGVRIEARSGAIILASTETGADGSYSLLLPANAGAIEIVSQTQPGFLSVSESTGNTGAANPVVLDDRIAFTAMLGGSYAGVNFGDVREPQLSPDHVRTAVPGTTVFLPHVFIARTTGAVTFAVPVADRVLSPVIPGWDASLFLDSDCDGEFDSGESPLTAPVAVDADAGSQVCLLLRLFVPSGAPVNAQWQGTLRAAMSYQGVSLQSERQVRDQVRTGEGEALVLLKSVDKESAEPGESLIYTVVYRNAGAQPVNSVVIRDTIPAFTSYVNGSAICVLPLPSALANCIVQAPAGGGTGPLEWQLGGTLQAGAEGAVRYQVTVDGN